MPPYLAQWIFLCLPSCRPGFEFQAHHLCFLSLIVFVLYLSCDKNEYKQKSPGLAHFKEEMINCIQVIWKWEFFCKIYLLIIIQVQFIHQITHFVLITRTLIINILTGLEQVCRNVLVVIKSSWASSCFSNLEKTHLGYVYFTSNLVRPSWDDDLHCEDFVILLIFQL